MAKQGIYVDVDGTKAVSNAIKKYGEEGRRLVVELTEIAGKETAREAKVFAPVDTGKLRQSIKAEKQNNYLWFVTAYEKYARWVEFGTSKMAAQPFMHPAFRVIAKQYIRDLKRQFSILSNKFNK